MKQDVARFLYAPSPRSAPAFCRGGDIVSVITTFFRALDELTSAPAPPFDHVVMTTRASADDRCCRVRPLTFSL